MNILSDACGDDKLQITLPGLLLTVTVDQCVGVVSAFFQQALINKQFAWNW